MARPVSRRDWMQAGLLGSLGASGLLSVRWAQARETSPDRHAETKHPWGGDGTIMGLLRQVTTSLRHSAYSHVTRVDEQAGRYEFDCSGMASWVLRRTAPVALGAVSWKIKSHRPLARDFYRRIAATRPGPARYGWRRVARVVDARPGDVIAWLRPANLRSVNTGHVAFVVGAPGPVRGRPDRYLLRIADASRYQHQDDSRRGTGRTGFGFGTILVIADPVVGEPVAYGWVGRRSRWLFETRMAIGRPVR